MEPTYRYFQFPGRNPEPVPTSTDPYSRRRPAGSLPVRDTQWTLSGFCGNAKVTTNFGDLPIEALRLCDPLRTVSGSIATVGWINKVHLDEEFLNSHPDARPVTISAGALGHNLPIANLTVSPHQKVNVSPVQFRQDFRLARDLVDMPGITRKLDTMLTYYQFHCTVPVTVCVGGVWVSVIQ